MSAVRAGMTLGVLAAIRAIVAIHGGSNRAHLLAQLDAAMDVERDRSVTKEEVNDE